MAYFIFKLVRIYDSDTQRSNEYAAAKNTLTTFAVMTILLVTVTIIICIWCWSNYGRGLVEHTDHRHKPEPPPKQDLFMDSYGSRPPNTSNGVYDQRAQGSRMEID